MKCRSAVRRRRARARAKKGLLSVSSRQLQEETVVTTFCPASLSPSGSGANNTGPEKSAEIELAERGIQVVDSLSRDLTELGLGSVIEDLSDSSSDDGTDTHISSCTAVVHASSRPTRSLTEGNQLDTIYEEIEICSG